MAQPRAPVAGKWRDPRAQWGKVTCGVSGRTEGCYGVLISYNGSQRVWEVGGEDHVHEWSRDRACTCMYICVCAHVSHTCVLS